MITGTDHLGTRIGGYRLVTEIASSPTSQVFLGKRTGPAGKEVTAAVKVFQPSREVKQYRERFLNEAHVIQQLRHPRILPMLDAGVDRGIPFIVTEYAVGGSLRSHLQGIAPQPLELDEALHSISQIAQAVQYAHYRNVLHSNLKPSNILFNRRGNALVSDFSLATLSAMVQKKPSAHNLYMAPEQFVGIVGPESDQYALGSLAYEMLTGHPPFEGQAQPPYKIEHLVPPSQHNPELPPYIDKAILTAMAKGLTQRHEGIQAFLNALCLAPTSTVPVPIVVIPATPLAVKGQTAIPTPNALAANPADISSIQTPIPDVINQKMPPSTPNRADQKTLTPLPPILDVAEQNPPASMGTISAEPTPLKAVALLPFSPDKQPSFTLSPVTIGLPRVQTLPTLFSSAKLIALRDSSSLSGRRRIRERLFMLLAGVLIVLSVGGLLLVFSAASSQSQQAITSTRTSHNTPPAVTSPTSITKYVPTTPPAMVTVTASTPVSILQIIATPTAQPSVTPTATPAPIPTSGTTPTAQPSVTPTATPAPTPTSGTTPTPVSGTSCSVHYAVTSQWPGGFGVNLSITNTGSTAINGWSLKFSFPNRQTITQLWNGSYTQSASTVTVTNLSYNASIPAGQSLSSAPGFNGTWNGTNASPTAFTLNGAACSVI